MTIQEPIREMLKFIASVAHARPMVSHSYEAEQLLKALHADRYLHPCSLCRATPTTRRGDKFLCEDCAFIAQDCTKELVSEFDGE